MFTHELESPPQGHSHVHWKSGNMTETVLDRDVVTTDH